MKRRIKVFLAVWVSAIMLALGALALSTLPTSLVKADSDEYEKLGIFTEVYEIVKKDYVEEVEPKKLIYGAIRGMLKELDPHSGFMPPEAYKEMRIDTKGEFGGLGIQVGIRDGVLTVIAPIEDTPAWKAGLKAGDKIIKIDGEPTADMTLMDAVHRMRGPKGTQVTLTIMREGWKKPKDFTITRDIIKLKSVKYKVIDDGIGYVKITQFQQNTAVQLERALRELNDKGIDSLILDLRNNPGGLLRSAVEVVEQFMPAGKVVVSIKGRSTPKKVYRTSGARPYYQWPMVVLVNQGSASASEIVAGALKDHKRALILGVRTFGKGSVQSIIPLSDGSGLRLTTALYYTPSGKSIHKHGIEPDVVVKLPVKEGEGHPVFREEDLARGGKKKKPTEFVPVQVKEEEDTQLQRAIDILKSWRVFKKKAA